MTTASYNYRSPAWSVYSYGLRLVLIMCLVLSAVSCGARRQMDTLQASETTSVSTTRITKHALRAEAIPAETTRLTLSMTALRDQPLPQGAVYQAHKGRLRLQAAMRGDSLVIDAETDSVPRLMESSQEELTSSGEETTQQREQVERIRSPTPWDWLPYTPYILLLVGGMYLYRKLYN